MNGYQVLSMLLIIISGYLIFSFFALRAEERRFAKMFERIEEDKLKK